jgi:hypothetical protein
VLITIPATNDRLIVHRFDVIEAMDKAGIDYLLVSSRPPQTMVKGSSCFYQIAVQSKKGGVKYRLETGPQGMSLNPTGLISWQVPQNFDGPETTVIVAITDNSGQEILHTFRIRIVGNP